MIPSTPARDSEDVVAPAVATHLVSSAFARHRTLFFCCGRTTTIAVRVAAEAFVPVLQAKVLEATSCTERSTHLLRCICTHVDDVALQVPVLIIDVASVLYERHRLVDHDIILIIRSRHVIHTVPPWTAADLRLRYACGSCSLITCRLPGALAARHDTRNDVAASVHLVHQGAKSLLQVLVIARGVAVSWNSSVLTVSAKLVVTETLRVVLKPEMLVADTQLSTGEGRSMNSHVVERPCVVADA